MQCPAQPRHRRHTWGPFSCVPAGAEADELLRQYVQEALAAKAKGGSTKLYDE